MAEGPISTNNVAKQGDKSPHVDVVLVNKNDTAISIQVDPKDFSSIKLPNINPSDRTLIPIERELGIIGVNLSLKVPQEFGFLTVPAATPANDSLLNSRLLDQVDKITADNSFLNTINGLLGSLGAKEIRFSAQLNGDAPSGQVQAVTEFGNSLINIRKDNGHTKLNYITSDPKINDLFQAISLGQFDIKNVQVELYKNKLNISPEISVLGIDGPISLALVNSGQSNLDKMAAGQKIYSSEFELRNLNNSILYETHEDIDNQRILLTKIKLFDDLASDKIELIIGTSNLQNSIGIQASGSLFGFQASGSGIYEQNFNQDRVLSSELLGAELKLLRTTKGFNIIGDIGGYYINPNSSQNLSSDPSNNYGVRFQLEVEMKTNRSNP